jgi:hypothetical protein
MQAIVDYTLQQANTDTPSSSVPLNYYQNPEQMVCEQHLIHLHSLSIANPHTSRVSEAGVERNEHKTQWGQPS